MSTTASLTFSLLATHRLFFKRPNTPAPLFPSLHSPLSLSSRTRLWPSEFHRKETGFPAKDDPIARSSFQTVGASRAAEMGGRCPVLLFDVMGTIVRDPFYEDVPAFFGFCVFQGMRSLEISVELSANDRIKDKGIDEEIQLYNVKNQDGFSSCEGLVAKCAPEREAFGYMNTAIRPALYRISMKELLMIKHPTAWIEFEKGLISEEELNVKFFKDKRGFDSSGLKACMANGYAYLEGVEALLGRLKSRGYRMHAFTNYPSWYELIEEKLELSKYLSWTFVSCHTGKRKPDPDAFVEAAKQLGLSPSDVIFIDDQSMNVKAAIQIGMTGLTFQGAKELERDLLALGVLL